MNSIFSLLLAISFSLLFHSVQAALYVINPQKSTTCHAGQPCTVEWLDDGASPLLTTIGVCSVALYTSNQQAVQQIDPVDVSKSHSLTFTPDPKAGPDSDTYYVGFMPINPLPGNSSKPYIAFTPFFSLDQMQGSFATPLPGATNPIPIPSSLSSSSTPSPSSTPAATTATATDSSQLSTSTTPAVTPTQQTSSSRFSTATTATISPSSTSQTSPSSSSKPNSASSLSRGRGPVLVSAVVILGSWFA